MPATAIRNQGKSMFVKEVLHDNPHANVQTVKNAWQSAGMDGTISGTLINKIRARLGLTGNLRGRRRKTNQTVATAPNAANTTPKRRGRPPKQATAHTNGMARPQSRRERSTLDELEIDIDRLLFKVVEFGTLPDVENALRKARRLLYAGSIAVF